MATDYSALTGDPDDATLNLLEAQLRVENEDDEYIVQESDIDAIIAELETLYEQQHRLSKQGPKQKHLQRTSANQYKSTFKRKAASTLRRLDYYRAVKANFGE